jgi:hypothetical protein
MLRSRIPASSPTWTAPDEKQILLNLGTLGSRMSATKNLNEANRWCGEGPVSALRHDLSRPQHELGPFDERQLCPPCRHRRSVRRRSTFRQTRHRWMSSPIFNRGLSVIALIKRPQCIQRSSISGTSSSDLILLSGHAASDPGISAHRTWLAQFQLAAPLW